jgi:alcohol dehydrogenase
MLLGAHLAGAAIEASMLGAAHSCANPLTARYGTTHGVAVGVMLPHVVRWNGGAVDELYGDLAAAAALNGHGAGGAAPRLATRLEELVAAAGLPLRLRDCGVEASRIGDLAVEAAEQWTARFNPRAAGRPELAALYEAAF